MQTPRRYILLFSLFSVLFLLSVGFINVVVNPFLMFEKSKIIDSFDKKPEAATRVRTFKKYQAENQGYEALIVGNSRVEMGLDPNSQFFANQHVYNVGVPGISVNAQIAYANNLMRTNAIGTVFIGVDFADFISRQAPQNTPYEFISDDYEDYLAATLSLDALNASLVTIFSQNQNASTRTVQGFNPANDYIPILKNEGQMVLTDQKLTSLATQIKGARFYKVEMNAAQNSSLMTLKEALFNWKDKGKKVVVFINPYQDLYYEVLTKEGLSQDFEIWSETIKEIAISTNSTFFDFTELGKSHSNLKNNEGELAYFWEPAHYKRELGEEMLKIIVTEHNQ